MTNKHGWISSAGKGIVQAFATACGKAYSASIAVTTRDLRTSIKLELIVAQRDSPLFGDLDIAIALPIIGVEEDIVGTPNIQA